MKNDMSDTCKWILRAIFWVPRALVLAAFALFIAAAVGVWVVRLPNAVALLVKAYQTAQAEGSAPERPEPATRSSRRRRVIFTTGSLVRRGEPPL